MVEISKLADEMAKAGITAVDLAAIGAGLTAAAVAGIAAKEALRRINRTDEERLAQQAAEIAAWKAGFDSVTEMVTAFDMKNIIKEALVAGSVLPDAV